MGDNRDISRFWLFCLGLFGFIAPKSLISFDFERTGWRIFQKRVAPTKFDIYVCTFWVPCSVTISACSIRLYHHLL